MMYLNLILHLQRTHWQKWILATELWFYHIQHQHDSFIPVLIQLISMTALLMGNILYMPHCTQLGKYIYFILLHWKVWHQQSMQRLHFLGSWTLYSMPVTLVSPLNLQFDNGIQVEWFDKTLSESSSGLKAQPIYHNIFIQRGGHPRTWTWHLGYSFQKNASSFGQKHVVFIVD